MQDSTFFSDFLMITNFKTIAFILVIIGLFFIIRIMERRKINFSIRMIVATLIGLLLGVVIQAIAGFPDNPQETVWLSEITTWYGLVGYGFMDLLKMLVVPLVFLSIIRVIMNIKGDGVGNLTARTLFMLIGTTALAAIIGIIVGNLFKLGMGTDFVAESAVELREVNSVVNTLRGLLPSNPVGAMAEANVVAVVIFAAFIGNAIKRLNKKYSELMTPVINVIEGLHKIITSVAMTVIKYMPYAIIALLANTITGRGIAALYTVLDFIIALYVSVIIMFIVHLVIVSLNGINPITYIKQVSQPLILAFTSRSSMGTLPVTIDALTKNVGLDNGVASFVGSLGSNMGMNGCAGIYPALIAVTIGNMTGIEMDFTFYMMLLVVISLGSLGIAGIPGSATMAVSVTLSGLGLGGYFPLVGGIIAIDPILDMGRTMLNVNGTMVSAVTVGKKKKDTETQPI